MTLPPDAPTREELVTQALNGDMVRIITHDPPKPLSVARKLEIMRRLLAVLTALAFGAAVVTAVAARTDVAVILFAAVASGLFYVVVWGFTIRYAHEARVALFRKYGVAPNRDGVFEMVSLGEPHEDLAATREMLRVYGG